MMKYHFLPQEDESLEFFFEASSFDEAVEKLGQNLESQGDWKVVKHSSGEFGVDLYLKNRYADTLLVSEFPVDLEQE
jgi:hypothetical protein